MTVATTTSVAPITNMSVGRKSKRIAVMMQEITILKLVAKTFNTLSAYFVASRGRKRREKSKMECFHFSLSIIQPLRNSKKKHTFTTTATINPPAACTVTTVHTMGEYPPRNPCTAIAAASFK